MLQNVHSSNGDVVMCACVYSVSNAFLHYLCVLMPRVSVRIRNRPRVKLRVMVRMGNRARVH